jgi:phage terminase large subunit
MLKISRDYVNPDTLQEFPVATRFIKLPIEGYLKLLPAKDPDTGLACSVFDTINRPQIALINAVNDPRHRFVCAALSRRLGKTYISNIVGQLVTLVPGSNVLIISPNYNLSSISFELQRSLIKTFDLEITRDNLKDRIIELSNGSTIRMGSLSTVDSCVGRSYQLIIFDESALGNGREAFNVALRPTLDTVNSKAIFISTPRGRANWFSEFFERGFSSEFPEWCSIQATYHENPRMTEKDVAEAKKSMSTAEFDQEYLASFNVFEGQIYTLNSEDIAEFSVCDRQEAFGGLDPGYKDPTAYVVIVYDMQNDIFWIVDEYLENQATTAAHAARIKEMNAKWGVDIVFIDSAAAQFSADLAYEHDIATSKSKKDVLPGIAYVQNLLHMRRLRVSPRCKNVLDMFDQYRWDPGVGTKGKSTLATEKPLHDIYSHMADAIRYALYTYTV